ncbi:MerR family DNA-binding protein [Pleurocapsa sp. PCC 7327]|uniref:MerR family DNA-binding protein n=1 Tax=Pleurocapsa sp. PCC 7327 TaxID=118163 RepID=UPI001C304458
MGPIAPPQRTESGYRLFSQEDVDRLAFITRAKSLGLTLEEIREILVLKNGRALTCQALYERLLKKLEQIDQNIRHLQALRQELLPLLNRCRQNLDRPELTQECVVLEEATAARNSPKSSCWD